MIIKYLIKVWVNTLSPLFCCCIVFPGQVKIERLKSATYFQSLNTISRTLLEAFVFT